MIQLPEEEVKVRGLKEGDELCLSYLVDDQMEGRYRIVYTDID